MFWHSSAYRYNPNILFNQLLNNVASSHSHLGRRFDSVVLFIKLFQIKFDCTWALNCFDIPQLNALFHVFWILHGKSHMLESLADLRTLFLKWYGIIGLIRNDNMFLNIKFRVHLISSIKLFIQFLNYIDHVNGLSISDRSQIIRENSVIFLLFRW